MKTLTTIHENTTTILKFAGCLLELKEALKTALNASEINYCLPRIIDKSTLTKVQLKSRMYVTSEAEYAG